MANISEIVTSTLEKRSRKLADNVTKATALLSRLKQAGNIRTFSGGRVIWEEIVNEENPNVSWYKGYQQLPTAAYQIMTAAEYGIKQLSGTVTISGLEELMNSSQEQMIDLLQSRIKNCETSMTNTLSAGIYSDGTGHDGKEITGLKLAVSESPTTGTYGRIDRASWPFWRNKYSTVASKDSLTESMNTMYASLTRGIDTPDLIVMGNKAWVDYLGTLQAQQRFTSPEVGDLGFASIKYMSSDVVFDGGIGTSMGDKEIYFLNTDYLFLRPHAQRNMVPIGPKERHSTNQDASVQVIGWAGNLTSSGAQFQGKLKLTYS